MKRYQEFEKQPQMIQALQDLLNRYEKMANDQSELYDHIKVDEKLSITQRVQELRQFLSQN